jgi:hypothetical protein
MVTARSVFLLALIGLLGTAAVLLTTARYGAGTSPDSVTYISVARNLAAGEGLIAYTGETLAVHPPLYPALLAVSAALMRVDALDAARVLNAVLFGLVVFLSGLLFVRHLRSSGAMVLLGTVAVLFARPLIAAACMALSEMLFIALMLVFLLALDAQFRRGDTGSLVLAAAAAALAGLTRYTGIALIPVGGLALLLFHRREAGSGMRKAWIFTAAAVGPYIAWLAHNQFFAGAPFGERAVSEVSLMKVLALIGATLKQWYLPGVLTSHAALGPYIIGLFALAVVGGLALMWASSRTSFLRHSPLLMLGVIYLVLILVAASTTAFDPVGDRLLAPVFVPLTIVLFVAAEQLADFIGGRLRVSMLRVALPVVVALWLSYPLWESARVVRMHAEQGVGFTSRYIRGSLTLRYARSGALRSFGGPVFTNAPDVLYLLAGMSARMSPSKSMYASRRPIRKPADLRFWPPDRGSLVWFDWIARPFLYTPAELQAGADIEEVARLKDGIIYRVHPKILSTRTEGSHGVR